jgi:hypothetical protein
MTHPPVSEKTIWVLWFQGMAQAPYVVRKCYDSWVERNQEWNVVFLDKDVLADFRAEGYLIPEYKGLSPQQASDLIRLSLLTHYGGVWADATCFCVSPLDDWLYPRLKSGFFAFSRPGRDRILSSWFLAAERDNYLVSSVYAFMLSYWTGHPIKRDQADVAVRVLARLLGLSPQTRSLWFSRLIRETIGASPYFALHYGFEKVIREDDECSKIWRSTSKLSADGPHKLLAAGLMSAATPEIRQEIDSRDTPVYKTTWKIDDSKISSASVLGYLLSTPPS